MEKNKEEKTEYPLANWIPFPRSILSLYMNGELNRPEFVVYCYLRLGCNPWGICHTHLEAITDDALRNEGTKKGASKNYANKIILSLKRKKLLFYEDRTGRTGSFEVRFPDFVTPDKKLTSITHLFEKELGKTVAATLVCNKAEVVTEVEMPSQKLESSESMLNTDTTKTNDLTESRGYNNDTDIEQEIENTELSVSYKKGSKNKDSTDTEYVCKNPSRLFRPNTYEEQKAKDIADAVGETCMDNYLALISRGYFWALEKGYGEYKEDVAKGKLVENPPAYMNGIIMRIIKERIGK